MLSFEIKTEVGTGIIETVDLTDIDRAVAGVFQTALGQMVVTDAARPQNREFASYERRPMAKKLYVGQFDEPQDFVTKLVSKSNDEREQIFPAAYISRDPSITYVDDGGYVDMTGYAEIFNSQGDKTCTVNKSFALLTYTLNLLTWDRSTLSRMGLGVTLFARHQLPYRKRRFTAKTMIANAPVTLNGEINMPKAVIGTPISASFKETRLNGLSFNFEVIVEVLEAVFVDEKIQTLTVDDVAVMENGGLVEVSGE